MNVQRVDLCRSKIDANTRFVEYSANLLGFFGENSMPRSALLIRVEPENPISYTR